MLILSLAPSFFFTHRLYGFVWFAETSLETSSTFQRNYFIFSFSKNSVRHGAGVFVFNRLLWGTVLSLTTHPA
jgi:hypothetical protein